jgi:kynurenine formamidase
MMPDLTAGSLSGPFRIIDLSHTITPGMPVWPGSRGPESYPVATIDGDGYAEHSIRLSTHTGTHLDAPSHIIKDGLSLDCFEPGRFFGTGTMIEALAPADGVIGSDMLASHMPQIRNSDFVLFHTGWSRFWGQEGYDRGYPVLDAGATELLAGMTLKGVGLDCPSFDPPDSHDYPVHRKLLMAGILLVENMTNLHLLPASGFLISVLPLPVAGAEAFPVRAVAVL